MKYATLLPLLACISFSAFAQPKNTPLTKSNYDSLNKEIYIQKPSFIELEKSLGSPYFNDSFEDGTIRDERTNTAENRKLRYNAYNDEFEVFYEDRIYTVSKSSTLKIIMGTQEFEFYAFQNLNSKKSTTGYLEVLDENKLYLRHKKEIKEGRESVNSMAASIPDKLIVINQLFQKLDNGELREVKWKPKTIITLYGSDDPKAFKALLKEKNLNIKDKNDLIQIINLQTENSAQ